MESRTFQTVNAEYFRTAAILGEKVAQIKAIEKEVDKLSNDLAALFSEVAIHKAALANIEAPVHVIPPDTP